MSLLDNSAANSKSFLEKKPILCYVTDRRSLRSVSERDSHRLLLEKIQANATAGIDWVQLREKDLSGKDFATLAREALSCVSLQDDPTTIPRIFLNDRLDVAISERAGGVHLGENSVPPADAKRLLFGANSIQSERRGFLIGVSCHSLAAAQSAASTGADYIFFGPVFATPSKATFGPPQGLEKLAHVCNSVAIPVLAIGGITLANASACFSAGASGIAAIRLFQDTTDLAELIRRLRS